MTRISRREVMRALPLASAPLVESIVEAAEARGDAVYLVGGPVRDLLLQRPIRDVDLLVEPVDSGGAADLARAGAPEGARIVAHERFGTVVVEWGDASIDIATARRESYARPGALPLVEVGSLEEDLARRDFSVNAMAVALAGPRVGASGRASVVDPQGGLSDLKEKCLRVLHEESFLDDPTRVLRAARLAPRLGFSLARGSRPALRAALRFGAFGAVSGERWRREFEKLFSDAALGMAPVEALRLLRSWHVLSALEPGLDLPRPALAPLRRLGKALMDPPWQVHRMRPLSAGLSVWLAPLAPALRRRVLARLSIRGDLADRVASFPKQRDGWLGALGNARGRGAVDAALHDIDEERLVALYACAPPGLTRRIVRWAAEDRSRRLPVSGSDLLDLGLVGPSVGRALGRIRAAVLDGAVANREEAMALARELARRQRTRAKRTAKARSQS